MSFDVDRAMDYLGHRAKQQPMEWPDWMGAPSGEFNRSPAASRVAQLAQVVGLHLFHFEHRVSLDLSEEWVPPNEPELVEAPSWLRGVLPEHKYQSFRHELPIGSFHPKHRAKWATHELCHGLVGFAWRPDATAFSIATAGRLAEVLPVALWYFLDEAFLTRCERHQGGGALFRATCVDCERVAAPLALDPDARYHLLGGRRFLDRELASIARSRRLGRPLSHLWSTIDLCSDGLAYASAHTRRLQSPAFLRFSEEFLIQDGGISEHLDALEARVLAVSAALLGDDLRPIAPTSAHGRWRWRLQDLGWRLRSVWADAEGEVLREIDRMCASLSEVLRATIDPTSPIEALGQRALTQLSSDYTTLWTDWVVPTPEAVFSVGYALSPGVGVSLTHLREGVESAFSALSLILEAEMDEEIGNFAEGDRPQRVSLPERWAAYIVERHGGALGELARYESALATLGGRSRVALSLGEDGGFSRYELVDGAQIHRFSIDVIGLAESAEAGEFQPLRDGERLVLVDHDGLELKGEPLYLLIGRDAQGDVLILDLTESVAEPFLSGARCLADVDGIDPLRALGVVGPVGWSEDRA